MLSGYIEYQDLRSEKHTYKLAIGSKRIEKSLVFERLFYSGYVAMAKIRFTEFLPSAGCHYSVCPHDRHLAQP